MSDFYRAADNYGDDMLIEEETCHTCSSQPAVIQCHPCNHVIVCSRCLIKLCTITFINNIDKVECFLCKSEIDEFYNIITGEKCTAGDIQDEYRERVRRTERSLVDDQAEEDEEMFDRELNPLEGDAEFAEDDYDIGELTEDEKQFLRETNTIIRHGNHEYEPSDLSDSDNKDDKALPRSLNQNSMNQSSSLNQSNIEQEVKQEQARQTRARLTRAALANSNSTINNSTNNNSRPIPIILDPVQTRSLTNSEQRSSSTSSTVLSTISSTTSSTASSTASATRNRQLRSGTNF